MSAIERRALELRVERDQLREEKREWKWALTELGKVQCRLDEVEAGLRAIAEYPLPRESGPDVAEWMADHARAVLRGGPYRMNAWTTEDWNRAAQRLYERIDGHPHDKPVWVAAIREVLGARLAEVEAALAERDEQIAERIIRLLAAETRLAEVEAALDRLRQAADHYWDQWHNGGTVGEEKARNALFALIQEPN